MTRRSTTRRVPASDDWHPTRADGTVCGLVMDIDASTVRVAFWGEDDTGVQVDVPALPGAWDRWSRWLTGLGVLSRADLLALGFRRV